MISHDIPMISPMISPYIPMKIAMYSGFTHQEMVDLSIVMWQFTRGYLLWCHFYDPSKYAGGAAAEEYLLQFLPGCHEWVGTGSPRVATPQAPSGRLGVGRIFFGQGDLYFLHPGGRGSRFLWMNMTNFDVFDPVFQRFSLGHPLFTWAFP